MRVDSTTELIDQAMAAWTQRTAVAMRTGAKRRRQVEILLGIRDHRIRPHVFGGRRAADRLSAGTWESDDGLDGVQWERLLERVPVPVDAVAEGEGAVDYLRPGEHLSLEHPRSGDQTTGPQRDRWRLHRTTMARLGFIHDPSTAQPFEYARIVARYFSTPTETMTTAEVEKALYCGLAMFHGMKPDLLCALRSGTGPVEDGTPQLDMGEGRVWLRLPRIGYCGTRDALLEHASRPGSPWASVPLVSPLRELAQQHRRNELRPGAPVFDPRRDLGRGQDGDAGGEADALVRLARSTPRWLVHHGLPAVLADLVAGRFRFTTLATSAYVNLSESTLARAHARAASAFWAEVLKERDGHGSAVPSIELVEALPSDRRFGSKIVPLLEGLRSAMSALNERRRHVSVGAPLAELVRAWNLEVIAEWIRLGWSTALRPRRDPVVTRDRLDARSGWLLVEDKHSRRFREVRPVPLPPGEGERLARIVELGDTVRRRLRASARVATDVLPDNAIFFAVVGTAARPLSPAITRDVLRQEGLGDLFPWPFNAARHFWLTRALELGIAPERVEPFLGHLHDPLPWGPFSVVPVEQAVQSFRNLAALILGEVGLAG